MLNDTAIDQFKYLRGQSVFNGTLATLCAGAAIAINVVFGAATAMFIILSFLSAGLAMICSFASQYFAEKNAPKAASVFRGLSWGLSITALAYAGIASLPSLPFVAGMLWFGGKTAQYMQQINDVDSEGQTLAERTQTHITSHSPSQSWQAHICQRHSHWLHRRQCRQRCTARLRNHLRGGRRMVVCQQNAAR